MTTRRPAKIIELDGAPASWRVEPNAVHLWKGKLWRKESVGCALCCEQDDSVTLSCVDDDDETEHFHCVSCGDLIAVAFTMKKIYVVTIGDIVRQGEIATDDTMLFPASLSTEARRALVERLLDEAQADETKDGPAP